EEPEELSNLARSAFTLSIQFFGDFLIASLLSKKIKLRELALNEIRKRIDYSISSDDNNDPSNDNAEDVVADKLALIKASYQVIQEEMAVKLVFEVVKRVGKQLIEPYFVNNRNVKYPNLINDIWKLVTEHETVNGEIIQRAPTPDPIITKPKNEDKEASKAIADPTAPLSNSPKPELVDAEVLELTEEELRELEELERLENFEIDQSLLSKPLAKRGTVTRIEQQLMELRSMANNTNNIINEDYDTASNKPSPPSSKKSSNSSRSATKPSSSNSTASSNKSKKSNNTTDKEEDYSD
ncbi:6138_t:CDS:2, partial [Entrophospora sp. SA101]